MAEPGLMFVLLRLRLQSEGGHHGHDMQEDHDVAYEGLRNFLPQHDLDVGPEQLIGEPEENAERHQAPEQASAAVILPDVGQKSGCSGEQKHALGDVAENVERKAGGDEQRGATLREHKAGCRQNP